MLTTPHRRAAAHPQSSAHAAPKPLNAEQAQEINASFDHYASLAAAIATSTAQTWAQFLKQQKSFKNLAEFTPHHAAVLAGVFGLPHANDDAAMHHARSKIATQIRSKGLSISYANVAALLRQKLPAQAVVAEVKFTHPNGNHAGNPVSFGHQRAAKTPDLDRVRLARMTQENFLWNPSDATQILIPQGYEIPDLKPFDFTSNTHFQYIATNAVLNGMLLTSDQNAMVLLYAGSVADDLEIIYNHFPDLKPDNPVKTAIGTTGKRIIDGRGRVDYMTSAILLLHQLDPTHPLAKDLPLGGKAVRDVKSAEMQTALRDVVYAALAQLSRQTDAIPDQRPLLKEDSTPCGMIRLLLAYQLFSPSYKEKTQADPKSKYQILRRLCRHYAKDFAGNDPDGFWKTCNIETEWVNIATKLEIDKICGGQTSAPGTIPVIVLGGGGRKPLSR